jgi:hypothetical protein
MNLGEFREQTKELPDDTIITVDLGDGEACETWDDLGGKFPPVLEHPWLIVIQAGSEVTLDVELDMRRDAQEECQK